MIWYDVMWCDVMWCDVMWCVVLCCVVLCCVVLCYVMLCYIILYYIILYYIILYYIILYYIILYYITLRLVIIFLVNIYNHVSYSFRGAAMLSSFLRENILVPDRCTHCLPATDEQITGVWESSYLAGRAPDLNVLRRCSYSRWCRNSIQLFTGGWGKVEHVRETFLLFHNHQC